MHESLQKPPATTRKAQYEDGVRYPPGVEAHPGYPGSIQRKSSCPCGGGCPACKSAGGLNISKPSDPAEIEADAIADRVMRMGDGEGGSLQKPARSKGVEDESSLSSTRSSTRSLPFPVLTPRASSSSVFDVGLNSVGRNPHVSKGVNSVHAPGMIHRKCDACENDEEKGGSIYRKSANAPAARAPGSPSGSGHAQIDSVISSGGRPLDNQTRSFFEPRFNADLSHVRIHTDTAAGQSARAVNASAYTLGSNIVFGQGEYRPETESGKHLLAHELAHVAQGNSGKLHRRLRVDAAGSDDPTTAIGMMAPLITQLCPDFETHPTTGVVSPRSGTPCSIPRFAAVAGGSHPLGCCCLCTMTRPWGADWRIIVTSTGGPSTNEGSRLVRMTPTSGPGSPELRHWTSGPTERTTSQPAVDAFGHELCGHAALMRIRAHERASTDRSFDDQHDPTVRIQNALAAEMGSPALPRGLAAGGTHRGESLRVFTVGPFTADSDDISTLSGQITAAANFLIGKPELLFDTVGFRDAADTNAAIGASRASRVLASVTAALTAGGASLTTDVQTAPAPAAPETLNRAQPTTDGGVGASRMVEIRMAVRPAGLITPIGTAPPATPVHVEADDPARVRALMGTTPGSGRGSVNECHRLLTETAWR